MISDFVESNLVPRVVAEILFAEARRDFEGNAFRYGMFAKRIIAAEHGRTDAVVWAWDWLASIVDEARLAMVAEFENRLNRLAELEASRAEFECGRCGNPYYQAYLDTIEEPARINHHADFMAWINKRHEQFKRQFGGSNVEIIDSPRSTYQERFMVFLRDHAEQHLSERIRTLRSTMNVT